MSDPDRHEQIDALRERIQDVLQGANLEIALIAMGQLCGVMLASLDDEDDTEQWLRMLRKTVRKATESGVDVTMSEN